MTYLILALALWVISLGVGFIAFKKLSFVHSELTIYSDFFSKGVFLGIGLITLLELSYEAFEELEFHYHLPLPLVVASLFFVLLYALEWKNHPQCPPRKLPLPSLLFMTITLFIHAFFDGLVLGLSSSLSLIILFISLVLHKGAESFSFAHYLIPSLTRNKAVILFLLFSLITPLGVLSGDYFLNLANSMPLMRTILFAAGSGVMIYLATAAHTKHKHDHNEQKLSYLASFVGGFLLILASVPFHTH